MNETQNSSPTHNKFNPIAKSQLRPPSARYRAFPIALLALTGRPTRHARTLLAFPQVYNHGNSLTGWSFWKSFAEGLFDGAACFLIAYFSATVHGRNSTNVVFGVGKAAFMALLGGVTLEVALIMRFWTWLTFWSVVLSYAGGFVMLLVIPYLEELFNKPNLDSYNVALELFRSGWFWMVLLSATALVGLRRMTAQSLRWALRPSDLTLITEKERMDDDAARARGERVEV